MRIIVNVGHGWPQAGYYVQGEVERRQTRWRFCGDVERVMAWLRERVK